MTTHEGHVFLFSDVEGSTRLWESYPGEMPLVLAEHDHLLRSAIEETEGQVFKHTGTAYWRSFLYPHRLWGRTCCPAVPGQPRGAGRRADASANGHPPG
jgi:class 3 adenylate cyclase